MVFVLVLPPMLALISHMAAPAGCVGLQPHCYHQCCVLVWEPGRLQQGGLSVPWHAHNRGNCAVAEGGGGRCVWSAAFSAAQHASHG